MYQVDVLMTPPRIEHVRTAQTQVTFGEIFQVAIHPSIHPAICLSVYISASLIYLRVMTIDEVLITNDFLLWVSGLLWLVTPTCKKQTPLPKNVT